MRRIGLAVVLTFLVLAPLAGGAQQPARLPTIGFLGASTPAAMRDMVAAFVGRLHELGWMEGRNIAIEYQWADGRTERFAEISGEFVRLKVDVIVTHGTAAVAAAKRATTAIPIVFASVGDPVGAGLVASLARPGGNITGLSVQQTDAAPKRLELLREVVPRLHRLAIVANADSRSSMLDMTDVRDRAGSLGLQPLTIEIRGAEQIEPAIKALKGKADALYVVADPLFFTNRTKISALAMNLRLPTMSNFREYAEAGCSMSYGPNYLDLFQRAATLVDKILKGAKPADLPVEQPTKFELVINLKTAKALGLTIPQSVLGRADAVIEQPVLDQRGQLLRAAVGFAKCSMPSYDRALWALRTWLDSWPGIGHVAVGMHRHGFDLQLTQYDDRGWRATLSTTGMEHSPTSATATAWERTPWHATQRAAWEALRMEEHLQ